MVAINDKGAWFTRQAALAHLNDGAAFVVTASVDNRTRMAGSPVDAASKTAVAALVPVLAGEVAVRGIDVNAVSPRRVETPIYGDLGLPSSHLQGLAEACEGKVPLGRFGRAE